MTVTNRLELFRDRIAAFDGAADPIRSLSKGYIVEEPAHSSTNALFKRIALRPQSKILLIGGIGSGKTTQLLRLQKLFQEQQELGIYPCYVDITQYTKPAEIQTETLDAIIGLELLKALENNGIEIDKSSKKRIEEFAYGRYVYDGYLQEMPDNEYYDDGFSWKKGVLSFPPQLAVTEDNKNNFISEVIKEFHAKLNKKPYFLFDGLDRFTHHDKFAQMLSSDRIFEIGFVIIGSSSILYSGYINSIKSVLHKIEYRSAFDVDRDKDSHSFFKKVLNARSNNDLFQGNSIDHLIEFSGGVLRDFINLTQDSIQEAYIDDADKVNKTHVESAVRSMGRGKILGLKDKQYLTLKSLSIKKINEPTSPEEIYLFASSRILEYIHPERRFAIHPVLQQLLG